MEEKDMIEDLISMLDSGMTKGVGHVNVGTASEEEASSEPRSVETMGCSDCSRTPLACSVPTLHDGIDDFK